MMLKSWLSSPNVHDIGPSKIHVESLLHLQQMVPDGPHKVALPYYGKLGSQYIELAIKNGKKSHPSANLSSPSSIIHTFSYNT